jgi:HEAT repeat protein
MKTVRLAYVALTLMTVVTGPAPAQKADEVRALLAQLRDRSPSNRQLAARELAKLGPKNRAAVPVLLPALNDNDEFVRQTATGALVRMASRQSRR